MVKILLKKMFCLIYRFKSTAPFLKTRIELNTFFTLEKITILIISDEDYISPNQTDYLNLKEEENKISDDDIDNILLEKLSKKNLKYSKNKQESRKLKNLLDFKYGIETNKNYSSYKDIELTEKNGKLIKTDEIIKRKKTLSAKKSRVKRKLLEVAKSIEDMKRIQIPKYIKRIIKNSCTPLAEVSVINQHQCLEFLEQLTKYELTIVLFSIPQDNKQINFLRNVFFKKKYIDVLFSSIDYN